MKYFEGFLSTHVKTLPKEKENRRVIDVNKKAYNGYGDHLKNILYLYSNRK